MRRLGRLLRLPPRRIAVGYLLFGAAWIVVTDAIVQAFAGSPAEMAQLQTLKGWVFVALSGVLILGLTSVREFQLAEVRRLSENAFQELQVLHRIFRHDFRNDLNTVLGYLDLVRRDASSPAVEERVDRAYDAAAELVVKGEKLRSLDRSSIHPRDGGRVDLAGLIRSEVEAFEASHPEVAVATDIPERAAVVGTAAIAQAVRELLENAVAHHPGPPSTIELAVTVTVGADVATVRIEDNGPGIPAGEIEPIVAGEESQLVHTSGVGLWLVAWVARTFDGEVSFERTGAGGNAVTLSFPRERSIGDLLADPGGALAPDAVDPGD